MTSQELDNLGEEEREEKIAEMLKEKLQEISDNEELHANVYHAETVYFIVTGGRILEISDDASCSPKGGWFPDIITGISPAENAAIEKAMTDYGIDECFFADVANCCTDDPEEDEIVECIEDSEDDEKSEKLQQLIAAIKGKKLPFASLPEFVKKMGRYGLDESVLYYEWEGDFIELWDNIADTGEPRGEYDGLSNEEWLDILADIESYIVTAYE